MGEIAVPELLLDCLGRKSQEEVQMSLEQMNTAKWQQLLEHSRQYGVAPLLYSILEPLFPQINIPPQITEQLRNIYLKSAGRNTMLYNQLEKLLTVFNKNNVPVILLKGAYLAEEAYGNIALRPMQDIDLLIRKEDVSRAYEILTDLGYSPVKPIHEEFDISQHHHIPQFVGSGKIPVEIHWNISSPLGPFKIDPEDLWRKAVKKNVCAQNISVLCTEDLLLHIIVHLSYHDIFEASLLSFYDIKVILEKFGADIEWKNLIQSADHWGIAKCFYLSLILAQKILGVSVPEEILAEFKPDDYTPKILAMAEEQLFRRNFTGYDISHGFAQAWEAERTEEKIILLLKRFFPSRQELATKYPAQPWSLRIYLYYPVRIKDLLFRYGRGFLGLLKKDEQVKSLVVYRKKAEELRQWMTT